MQQFFKIGAITSPHGIRGEVNVFPTTDDPSRFLVLDEVILRKTGRRGDDETRQVERARLFKNMVILKLSGCDTRNDAELLRKAELFVPREKAIPLDEGEYFIADIIGMTVTSDAGDELGTVEDVLKTGANDVYVVRGERFGEILIPAIKQCIIEVNPGENSMKVHLLPGMADEK